MDAGRRMNEDPAVVLVTGSVARGTFAWDSSGRAAGTAAQELVDYLAATLRERKVALGLDVTAWLPVPRYARDLGKTRPTDPRRHPWTEPARAAATTVGLEQACWLLRGIATRVSPKPTTTIRWDRWRAGWWSSGRRLLLWEARPPGAPTNRELSPEMARAVLDAFEKGKERTVSQGTALNLLAVAASWAGLPVKPDELKMRSPSYGPA